MHERKTGDTPMNGKKLWTSPVLQVILLNAAQNSSGGSLSDGVAPRSIS